MRWREENDIVVFILVHSITKLGVGFHYIQKFYKSHTKITLLNKETQNIFDSQKSSITPYKIHIHRLDITLGKQPEA